MPKISAVRDRLKRLTLATFSQPVFIRGIEYSAIFRDEEYTDEVGTRRILTLSVDSEVANSIEKDDPVFFEGASYKIDHIPTTTDPLVEMDLKNA
jgi:hypothetical protein